MNPAYMQWQRLCALKPELSVLNGEAILAQEFARRHGHFDVWMQIVNALPRGEYPQTDFSGRVVRIDGEISQEGQQALEAGLKALMPWRKGPFSLYGVEIDSEWRSDMKFARLLEMGIEFSRKQILDVGSGNGYFLYRMLGEGAKLCVGVDPSWHCFAQYLAVAKMAGEIASAYLPTTLDALPLTGFDLTLSMGVLYHRRDPLGHLAQLRDTLLPGGTLLMETLVVEGDERTVLVPQERYAGMRNVWFLPSVEALRLWLARLGFVDIVSGEIVATTAEEQRATPWMDRQSLCDFMQSDFTSTMEGLPPPRRVMIRAHRA